MDSTVKGCGVDVKKCENVDRDGYIKWMRGNISGGWLCVFLKMVEILCIMVVVF